MAQEVGIGGAQSSLRGGKLEVLLSQAFEEGANRLDMRYFFLFSALPTTLFVR